VRLLRPVEHRPAGNPHRDPRTATAIGRALRAASAAPRARWEPSASNSTRLLMVQNRCEPRSRGPGKPGHIAATIPFPSRPGASTLTGCRRRRSSTAIRPVPSGPLSSVPNTSAPGTARRTRQTNETVRLSPRRRSNDHQHAPHTGVSSFTRQPSPRPRAARDCSRRQTQHPNGRTLIAPPGQAVPDLSRRTL
jgi:hypothetical protein